MTATTRNTIPPIGFNTDLTGAHTFQAVTAFATIAAIISGNKPAFTTAMFAIFAVSLAGELAIRSANHRSVQFVTLAVVITAATVVGVAV